METIDNAGCDAAEIDRLLIWTPAHTDTCAACLTYRNRIQGEAAAAEAAYWDSLAGEECPSASAPTYGDE
jgi:hypothetical protein